MIGDLRGGKFGYRNRYIVGNILELGERWRLIFNIGFGL